MVSKIEMFRLSLFIATDSYDGTISVVSSIFTCFDC